MGKTPDRILAIDTSSVSGSIALIEGGTLAGELTVGDVGRHSEWLLGAIDEFLKDLGVAVADVDLFAVGNGPGSFTGLRIGVSTLKGLAWALKRPVLGVSTLEALAMNVNASDALICPILDARKKEVYSALFRLRDGRLERLIDDKSQCPEELVQSLKDGGYADNTPLPLTFIGQGLPVYGSLIKSEIEGCVFEDEDLWEINAGNIGLIAHSLHERAVKPLDLSPTYRRASEAEFKRKQG